MLILVLLTKLFKPLSCLSYGYTSANPKLNFCYTNSSKTTCPIILTFNKLLFLYIYKQ